MQKHIAKCKLSIINLMDPNIKNQKNIEKIMFFNLLFEEGGFSEWEFI